MHSSVLKKNHLQFKAASVASLLQQLIDIQKRREQGEELTVPSVTLHLTSGRELIGYVLDLITSDSGGSVVLQTHIEQAKPRVIYTDLAKIEAVGFFQKIPNPVTPQKRENPFKERPLPIAPKTMKVAAVKPAKVRALPVKTATEIDLQKEIIALQSLFASVLDTTLSVSILWSGITKSAASYSSLKETIHHLKDCLTELSSASIRKEGLRDQLKEIEIVNGEVVDLSIESGVLTLRAPFASGKIPFSSAQALVAIIESKLF